MYMYAGFFMRNWDINKFKFKTFLYIFLIKARSFLNFV